MSDRDLGALADKVAVVTGAASGIGLAVALRFMKEGARVVAIDRDAAALEALAEAGPAVRVVRCDVTDHPALENAVDETLDRHGHIDVLINNAGFSYYKLHIDSTIEEWRRTQAVNVEAMYALTKFVTPAMISARYGRIVNVASIQAVAAGREVTAYAASKGAVAAWTRALAVELAEHDIIVNAVAPGCIYTPMCIVDGVDTMLDPDYIEWYVRRRKIPLGRSGRAEEVAAAILFLSGSQCTYVTGHTLVVDGGLTITF
jgi:NAD(P)-dependent dehydrogenase (short-subunit alcohol dehydrogenase family)